MERAVCKLMVIAPPRVLTREESDRLTSSLVSYLRVKGTFVALVLSMESGSHMSLTARECLAEAPGLVVIMERTDHWELKLPTNQSPTLLQFAALTDVVSAVQTALCIGSAESVAVGSSTGLAEIALMVRLTYFVGNKQTLSLKQRNTIPLFGQGVRGVCNVLLYYQDEQAEPLIDYKDMLNFARAARDFYASPEAPKAMLGRAKSAAREVIRAIPDVTTVFGAGYPFYLANDESLKSFASTPSSIMKYMDSQLGYLSRKLLEPRAFARHASSSFSLAALGEKLGLTYSRDAFERYEYTKLEREPPPDPPDGLTLDDYLARNCFDLKDDVWPCVQCTALHDATRFPNQASERNFNEDCLGCMQTSFLLRNVMGCTTDVDLILCTRGDPMYVAENVARLLRSHKELYIYDTAFERTVVDGVGPVDAFIVAEESLWRCLEEDVCGQAGVTAVLDTVAVWLPLRQHSLGIGADFLMAFEPLHMPDQLALHRLRECRNRFANSADPDEILSQIRCQSFYHEQLLENESIRRIIRDRLARWGSESRWGIL